MSPSSSYYWITMTMVILLLDASLTSSSIWYLGIISLLLLDEQTK